MDNFKRQNTSSSKIKDNFSRDIEGDNRKKFIKNLLLLIIAIGVVVFLIFRPKPPIIIPPLIAKDTVVTPKVDSNQNIDNRKSIQIRTTALSPGAINGNFKASFESKTQEWQSNHQNDTLFDFESFYINTVNNNIVTSLNVKPGSKGFPKYTLVLNPLGKPKESLNNTLFKNQGSVRINTQSLNGFEYHLIGIK